jgi:putative drug exporter of the RND superfamily
MKRTGEKFKEYDSDNLVLVTLVGEQPLGQDAHQYYDDLVKSCGRLRPGQPAR